MGARRWAWTLYAGGTIVFGRTKNELERPPVAREPGATEILRVWGGTNLPQQYSLNTTWEDPGAWGLLLVDVARHAAKAYGSTGKITEQEALARIQKLLHAEWNAPTDEPIQIK